jgi:hypothetical protein
MSTPTVRALPLAQPLPFDDVKGAVSYLITSRDQLDTIALHDLFSGDVTPRARFSSPTDVGDHTTTSASSFGRSVAIVVSSGSRGWVAFAPHERASQGWIPGVQAAWLSETELLVRRTDGTVTRWSASSDGVDSTPAGDADEIIQTDSGAVVRRGRILETVNAPRRELALPSADHVLAVSPDTTHAVIDPARPALWDGKKKTPLRATAGRAIGATFEASGERAAILMVEGDELTLAVTDASGNAALKPLGGGAGACPTAPAWDKLGRWIYVATVDGVLHAIEAGGGRIESIKTHGLGCGVAWVDVG